MFFFGHRSSLAALPRKPFEACSRQNGILFIPNVFQCSFCAGLSKGRFYHAKGLLSWHGRPRMTGQKGRFCQSILSWFAFHGPALGLSDVLFSRTVWKETMEDPSFFLNREDDEESEPRIEVRFMRGKVGVLQVHRKSRKLIRNLGIDRNYHPSTMTVETQDY